MPMQLDMLAIELSVMQSDVHTHRDHARVNAIIDLIKKKFPQVQPEAHRQQLRLLINRLLHVSIYNGIVLRLPGTIDGPPPPPSYDLADVQQLEEDVTNLTSQLQSERQSSGEQLAKHQREIADLRKENGGLRGESQRWQDEKKHLQSELKQAEEQEYKANTATRKYHDRVAILEEEKAELQVALDKERRERLLTANLQRELATLRHQLSDAKEIEKQLRKEQTKIERENELLHEKLRRLAEDITQPNRPSTRGGDTPKGPWLD
jgi:hypothetical protein